jgi:hypothetical protein
MHNKAATLFIILFFFSAVFAQDEDVKQNSEIYTLTCAKIISQVITDFSLSPDCFLSVEFTRVSVQNSFLRSTVLETLSKFSKNLFEKNNCDSILRIDVSKIQTLYSQPFTEGWFESQKTIRTSEVELAVELTSHSTGKIYFAKSFHLTQNDTIPLTAITQIENPQEPLTIGKKPKLPFFQSIIEPAVIICAAGIAVYLFFTVRS